MNHKEWESYIIDFDHDHERGPSKYPKVLVVVFINIIEDRKEKIKIKIQWL